MANGANTNGGSKGQSSMKVQMHRRLGLLSRVSTLAIIAAAGGFGSVQQAEAAGCATSQDITGTGNFTVSTNVECVTAHAVVGNVTNNAHVGDPGVGFPSFFVGKGGISGELLNNSLIVGGHSNATTTYGVLTIGSNVAGGVRNEAQITSSTGNAIQLGYKDGSTFGAAMTGNITNNAGIAGGLSGNGIAALYGTMSGALNNNLHGVIAGGDAGVYIANTFAEWSGGIYNAGSIHGDAAGIQIGSLQGGEGNVIFSGGIFNDSTGTVSSLNGPAIFVDGVSFSGGLTNYGVITELGSGGAGLYDGSGVVFDSLIVNGGIHNFGQIHGVRGPGVWVTGGEFGLQSFNGDFQNAGSIDGATAGVLIQAATIKNSGSIGSTAAFTNTGTIAGGKAGFVIDSNSVTADFSNGDAITHQGLISGATSAGLVLSFATWKGNITNDGTITGGSVGMAVGYDPFLEKNPRGTLTGNIINNLSIMGVTSGLRVELGKLNGNITNNGIITGTGTISDSNFGAYIDVNKYVGNFDNSVTGRIIDVLGGGEGSAALRIGTTSDEAMQSFTGNISNEGLIKGAHDGVVIVLDSYDGSGGTGFTNSGSIIGGNHRGVYIDVTTWKGNITNAAGGYIAGGSTGFFMNAGSISGNFTNDGTIVGFSFDTGMHIQTPSYTGNIANGVNGLITAPSNALHLEIDAFSGQITNAGTIASPFGSAVVLEGYNTTGVYTGAFTNTGTISGGNVGLTLTGARLTGGITNNGGTISGGTTAITTYGATGATTITNKGNGLIIGDVRLANNFADTYVGEQGGIIGNIIGDPAPGGEGSLNDDRVVVQNGAQYFIGTASNLASFNVDSGGTAIMGATFEGDLNGTGYSFANVDAINVNNGGALYIDKSTKLTAGTYTQQNGGNLAFFLAAPGGAGFSSLTGTQIANPSTDYGQIHLTGAATLDGTISAFLDPAYGSANSGLNAVVYNDVLVADGGITGNFNTLAIINNTSLFELNEVLDGNTVDLTVSRIPLGQIGGIPGIVVEIGGPWKSMVNDRSNGIGSGSCSLAGSGWCLNAFAANNTPGATQVMNDASPGADAFDWLRTGQRRVGETAVWGRGVGVWGNTDGDNVGHPGTNFGSHGAIVGIDHVFTPLLMAGAAAQWTKSNIDFSGLRDNADVDSLEVGGYMSYGDARLYLNANASAIFHDISVTRFAPGGQAHGDYNGTTASAYAEAGKIFETYEGLRIQPLAALSYARLDTNAYKETGSANTLLHVFDATFDSLKSMIGARFAYPIAMDSGRKFVPEFRAVWAHEFMDDQSSFLANPISNPLNVAIVTGQQFNRDTIILGAGVTAPLSDGTTVFLDYDAALNENITTNTVSGGLRTRW